MLAASLYAVPGQCAVHLKTRAPDPRISSAVYHRTALAIFCAFTI